MNLRPRCARWFEVLTPRMAGARTVAALARTGVVEVELSTDNRDVFDLEALHRGLSHYRRLVRRYARYWARGELRHSTRMLPPSDLVRETLRQVETWRQRADSLINRLQGLEEEQVRLRLWQALLSNRGVETLDIGLLAEPGPVLEALIVLLPQAAALQWPASTLLVDVSVENHRCTLALGSAERLSPMRHEIRVVGGRILERPQWISGHVPGALKLVSTRLGAYEDEIAELYLELDRLHEDMRLPEALGDLACLEWFSKHVGPLPVSGHFAWITGWTSDPDGSRLAAAVEREQALALVRLVPAPAGAQPPLLLQNPWWARPFEVFARALGMPATDEVDPSPLLAFVVPLLFGYMFGDVGQGLVLLGLGWVLRQRWPLARLLMAGGLSAAGFGLFFGSVFSRADVIPSLWLHPLESPLTVLTLPLVFGVALLSLSQVLKALEAFWRGDFNVWLFEEAGLLLLYLGTAASILHREFIVLALVGLSWYLLGGLWLKRSLRGLLVATGELVEYSLRLLVNTLSFARVGAFALAHAGLSFTIATLADAAPNLLGTLAVMVLGNAFVIALETIVVSIQTTRLVLFEFFTRFLRAVGRGFQPLAPPPTTLKGEAYEVTA